MKIKYLTLLLLFLITATASAQWSQTIDTLTAGKYNDINPRVDGAGFGLFYSGSYGYAVPGEWVVFERWDGNSNAISAVKFSAPSLKWGSIVSTISPAQPGVTKKYPDVCTAGSGVSLAAWQQESRGVWNIYYSTCNVDSGNWSAPTALTSDSVSNTNVEVTATSDSGFVIMWKRKSAILFTDYKPGNPFAIDTFVTTSNDSADFDIAGNMLLWTEASGSGGDICLISAIKDFSTLAAYRVDTLVGGGNISNPRFMVYGGSASTFTYNLYDSAGYSVWWSGYPISNTYTPVKLAGDTAGTYLSAVFYAPAYLTSTGSGHPMRVSATPSDFWVWERRSASDTSLSFNEAGSDSILQGSNPSISPLAFGVTSRTSLSFVVWQSDVSGRPHIYSRSFFWTQTGIDEPVGPPACFRLNQNYPNPFNPTTKISYQLSAHSHVTLKVYDVLGREVATLVDGSESAGNHSVVFNGSRFASGAYFYRLTAPGVNIVKKMLLEK